jgi:response regulator RpfG family c-di-GMP phosphodiesterase
MSTDREDFFYLEKEGEGAKSTSTEEKWKIMIVDDDKSVHEITLLSLRDFIYDDKGLEFLHAYSGEAAKELIDQHPDTALILLDVVMETDDAGLLMAKYIRETAKNQSVRIVLRTGQAGQAPEKEVILNYDINDYKEKSELTIQKLYTTVISSLRSYKHITTLDENRLGLEKIIRSAESFFELQSVEEFSSDMLNNLYSVLSFDDDKLTKKGSGFIMLDGVENPTIFAGSGVYTDKVGKPADKAIEPEIFEKIKVVLNNKKSVFSDDESIIYIHNKSNLDGIIYMRGFRVFSEWDRRLIEIFCSNASIALDNATLYEQINVIHEAAITSLAKLAEFKDTDTGEHIQRVAVMTEKITNYLNDKNVFPDEMDDILLENVKLASVLHDIGKVGIPEKILLKPGKLTEEEWKIVKKHPVIGGEILRKAAEKVRGKNPLSVAADIASFHHEKYNGKGYPTGLKGQDIPLSARIVAVVDVYDALISKRPYKDPFPMDEVIKEIKKGSGESFDPEIVNALLEIISGES